MTVKNGSMGSLLQGISKQPDRVRLDGQVTSMVNLFPDAQTGLNTRPGSRVINSALTGADPRMKFSDFQYQGESFIAGFVSGKLTVWKTDGTVYTEISDSYIGSDMRFYEIKDKIMVLNRNKTVRSKPHTGRDKLNRIYIELVDFAPNSMVNIGIEAADGSFSYFLHLGTGSDPVELDVLASMLSMKISKYSGISHLEIKCYENVIMIRDRSNKALIVSQAPRKGNAFIKICNQRITDTDSLPWIAWRDSFVQVVPNENEEYSYWLTYISDRDYQNPAYDVYASKQISTRKLADLDKDILKAEAEAEAAEARAADAVSRAEEEADIKAADADARAEAAEARAEAAEASAYDFSSRFIQATPGSHQARSYLHSVEAAENETRAARAEAAKARAEARDIRAARGNTPETRAARAKAAKARAKVDDLRTLHDNTLAFRKGTDISPGKWYEVRNPYEPSEFDPECMPKTINASQHVLERIDWEPRRVGDSVSTPFVSLVDNKIRDISDFEGRLVFITKDSVVMSRTNKPFDFWVKTATESVETDRIDIKSTENKNLDWLVPFDRDLFIFSDPGKAQFIIKGGGLTPNNASMTLTSEFEIDSDKAKPVSTGRSIFLPYLSCSGKHASSGVREFYTDSDIGINSANKLTESQAGLISGKIRDIKINQTYSTVLFLTGNRDLYLYKYLWDDKELLQSAWFIWRFNTSIAHAFFDKSLLYVVEKSYDDTFLLRCLDLEKPTERHLHYHPSLDGFTESQVQQDLNNTHFTRVSMPINRNLRIIQGPGCKNPGYEAYATGYYTKGLTSEWVTFDKRVVPVNATIFYGIPVCWELIPTQPFIKDSTGKVNSNYAITVQNYIVHAADSGIIRATLRSPYSSDTDYQANYFARNAEKEPKYHNRLFTGDLYIPWGERADWSTLRLHGDDIRPVNLLEIEWEGQVTQKSKGGRRG